MKRIFTLLFIFSFLLIFIVTKAQVSVKNSGGTNITELPFCSSSTETISITFSEKKTGSWDYQFKATGNSITLTLDGDASSFTFENTDADPVTATINSGVTTPTPDVSGIVFSHTSKVITITFNNTPTANVDDILFGNIKIKTPDNYVDDEINFDIGNNCLENASSQTPDKNIKLTSAAPELEIDGKYCYNESAIEVSFKDDSYDCSTLTLQKWDSVDSEWDNINTSFDYSSKVSLDLDDQIRLITGAGRYSDPITFNETDHLTKPVFTAPAGSLTNPCWSDIIALTTTYNFGTATEPNEYRLYLNGTITPILTIDPDDLEATLKYTPTADGTLLFSAYFTDGPEIFSDPPLTVSGLITMGESYSLISSEVVPYAEGEIELMDYFEGAKPTLPSASQMDIDFGYGLETYQVYGDEDGFYKFILPYDSNPSNNTTKFDTKEEGVFLNYNTGNDIRFYYGVEVGGKVCYDVEQTSIYVIRDRIFVPAQSFCSTDNDSYTILIDKNFNDFKGQLALNYEQKISFDSCEFSIGGTVIDPSDYTYVSGENEEITFSPFGIDLDGADQVLIDVKANLIIETFLITGGTGDVYPAWAAFTDYDYLDRVNHEGRIYRANQDIPVEIGIIPELPVDYLGETKSVPDNQTKLYPRMIFPVPSSTSIYWYDIGSYVLPGSDTTSIGTLPYEYASTSFYIFKTEVDGNLNLAPEYCISDKSIEVTETNGYTIDSIMKSGASEHAINKLAGIWKFKPENMLSDPANTFETISWYLYYTDKRGCSAPAKVFSFNVDQTVDYIAGEANLGLNAEYCPENTEINLVESSVINKLIGNVEVDDGGLITEITDKLFNPSEFWSIGDPAQTLQFNFNYRHDNGCAYIDNFEVTVNPVPSISYNVENVCFGEAIEFSGPTEYPNNTDKLTWVWDFNDSKSLTLEDYRDNDPVIPDNTHNGITTGTYKQPLHNYLSAGEYTANLKVTSENGCATESDFNIIVGSYPKVNFTPSGFVQNSTTSFINSSSDEAFDPVNSAIWNFDDPTSPDNIFPQNSIQSTTHQFVTTGVHDVILTLSTATGCESSDTVKVPVFPLEIVTSDITYEASFDAMDHGWIEAEEYDKGLPSGWKLQNVAGSFNSGSNTNGMIWQTGDPADDIKNENSWVESPCFDISGLDFPLLSMDIYQSVEAGSDGAAVQYTINDGKSWKLLGDLNEGVNWYDTRGIVSNPGTQSGASTGWSLNAKEWKTARYTLDDLKKEISDSSASYVRFRVAYASNSGNAPGLEVNGFAFDNFTLTNRNRVVMIEQFVNSVHNKTLQEQEEEWLDDFLNGREAEVVDMRYHNKISHDTDPLFEINKPDISSRSMEYGATRSQLTMVDGIRRCVASESVSAFTDVDYYYKERTLTDISFDIDVTHYVNGENLEITADITKEKEDLLSVGSQKCVVRMAIVQHGYEHNGETYKNVVVELLPNGEGNVVASIPADFAANETMTVTGTWTPNVTTTGNEFRLVVYVQGIWGVDEVHQAWFEDSIAVPQVTVAKSAESEKSGESNSFTIYPSPVKEKLNISWHETLENPIRWKLVSMSGSVVKQGITPAGQIHEEIYTYQFNRGIYLLITEDQTTSEVEQRKIVIVK